MIQEALHQRGPSLCHRVVSAINTAAPIPAACLTGVNCVRSPGLAIVPGCASFLSVLTTQHTLPQSISEHRASHTSETQTSVSLRRTLSQTPTRRGKLRFACFKSRFTSVARGSGSQLLASLAMRLMAAKLAALCMQVAHPIIISCIAL